MNINFLSRSGDPDTTFVVPSDRILQLSQTSPTFRNTTWKVVFTNDDGVQEVRNVGAYFTGTVGEDDYHEMRPSSLRETLEGEGLITVETGAGRGNTPGPVYTTAFLSPHSVIDTFFDGNSSRSANPGIIYRDLSVRVNEDNSPTYVALERISEDTQDSVKRVLADRYSNITPLAEDIVSLDAQLAIAKITISSMEADLLRVTNDLNDFEDSVERRFQDLQRSS